VRGRGIEPCGLRLCRPTAMRKIKERNTFLSEISPIPASGMNRFLSECALLRKCGVPHFHSQVRQRVVGARLKTDAIGGLTEGKDRETRPVCDKGDAVCLRALVRCRQPVNGEETQSAVGTEVNGNRICEIREMIEALTRHRATVMRALVEMKIARIKRGGARPLCWG